jgi:hypothetical protein
MVKIIGRKQFKYTYNLWNVNWINYASLCRGRNRILIRILLALPILSFDILRVVLTFETILVDLYRMYRTDKLYFNYFKRGYKPYVLQEYYRTVNLD